MDEGKSVTRGKLPVAALLGSSLFCTGISYASTLPYRGIVAIEALGISNDGYAAVMTASSLATAGAALALGALADRIGDRRRLVLLTAALGAVAHGSIFLFHTPLAYIIAFCVILPFGGALFSQTFSFSRAFYNAADPARAQFMMSVLRTIFALAWVVFPPIAGFIAARFTVFDVFGAAALAHLGVIAIFLVIMRDDRTRLPPPVKRTPAEKSAEPPIERYRLVGIGGVTLVQIAMALHITGIPLAIINNFGGTLGDVGIMASLAAGLEVPCMLFWGWAATRVSKETVLIVNSVIYGVYLLALFGAHTVGNVLWLQPLNAIATAALVSITIAYMQDAIRGRVGLSTSLMDVVGVVSSLAAAALFALLAHGSDYALVFVAGGVLSFVGAAVTLLSWLQARRVSVPSA